MPRGVPPYADTHDMEGAELMRDIAKDFADRVGIEG